MKQLGTTEPDSDPRLQRLISVSRARKGQTWLERAQRELPVESFAAAAFLATAVLMAILIDGGPSFEPALAFGLLGVFVLAARVEFYMGAAFTCPTQVAFVPMLFLLPTSAVPLFVAAGLVLSRLPEYVRGEVRMEGAVVAIGDSWHAVGPALVLSIAGATAPDWADWPVYLIALAAQFGFDLVTSIARIWLGQGIRPRALLQELRAIYLVDALLSPIGLLAAFASAGGRWAFLLVLPLIGLIRIFAEEREGRIENALTLSSAYRGTAHLLEELLSTTHEYTGNHSRSVVVLAHQVSTVLGLDERTLREVEFGALLHDVGKIAVPNEIINKPGKLDEHEWAVMQGHTIEGERMLEQIGGALGEVGEVIRSHHERFDGTGYPDGLRGEDIPIAARVITASDSFNAMTTDRPYSAAMTVSEAIAELRDNAGTQFDPAVVVALIAVVETWERPEEPPPVAVAA